MSGAPRVNLDRVVSIYPLSDDNQLHRRPTLTGKTGHAIWIGNLPPQTDLMSLVHHVCKEALALESLFLISKSNCAFANFKDEASCVAAQQKLHDSKFQSVRLVSRLRKNTVEGATGLTAPTGPAAGGSQSAVSEDASLQLDGPAESKEGSLAPTSTSEAIPGAAPDTDDEGRTTSPPQKDKFFILKSLTVEDLELSVQTGIWATQSHNEEVLNKAFAVSTTGSRVMGDRWKATAVASSAYTPGGSEYDTARSCDANVDLCYF